MLNCSKILSQFKMMSLLTKTVIILLLLANWTSDKEHLLSFWISRFILIICPMHLMES